MKNHNVCKLWIVVHKHLPLGIATKTTSVAVPQKIYPISNLHICLGLHFPRSQVSTTNRQSYVKPLQVYISGSQPFETHETLGKLCLCARTTKAAESQGRPQGRKLFNLPSKNFRMTTPTFIQKNFQITLQFLCLHSPGPHIVAF